MTDKERIEEQGRELERLRARVAALEHAELECVRSQESLRQSEERFRRIFDHSNDAIFVIDPFRDEILNVNAKACTLLGYSRDELLSKTITAIHPDEMPDLLAFARSVFEQGTGWTNELTCLTKSGNKLPAEISASVIDISDRTYMIALVRDITDRKRAEEALQRYSEDLERQVTERTAQLRRSEERQRVLLEINNAIISNFDRKSLFRAIAQALRRVIPFDLAVIFLHDPTADVFRLAALEKPSLSKHFFEVGAELGRQGSHVGWVFDQRKSLLRPDLGQERQFPIEEKLLGAGVRSYLIVPLLSRGTAIGTLNLGSKTANQYSEKDGLFLEEVAKQVALAIENMLAYEEIAQLKAQLEQENLYLQEEIKIQHRFEEIIGQDASMKRVLKAVETVAPTDATVLILGETGTGKELVARAVHNLSGRKDRALVRVNCAALPAGLIESELFGHEKGAFTGALSRKIGRFELANSGTIFLDEIADLPLDLQVKLLRVLQEGEFERVGGSPTIKAEVRVIAATNRALEQAIQEGRFRPDLYYRLNVFPIQIPSLQERKKDIPLLVRYFVMKYGTKLGKRIETIPVKTMEALQTYPWPGNVRELENVIERGVIITRGAELELGEWIPKTGAALHGAGVPTLEELEREQIIKTLELTGGRVSGEKGAAKMLGLKPTTLEARMKKLGIRRKG